MDRTTETSIGSAMPQDEPASGRTEPTPSPGFSLAAVGWAVAGVVVAGLAFFALIYVQDVTSVGSLTRDPTVTAEEPWYLGAASSLGAVGWAAAAAFFGLSALVVRRAGGVGSVSLGLASGYSLLLLIDDVYLLHDDILLRAIGSEVPVYAVYLLLGVAWFASALRLLEPPMTLLLAVSTVLFALSIAIDLTWQSDSDLRLVVEDGAKFIGIWSWALFALTMGTAAIERATAARGV